MRAALGPEGEAEMSEAELSKITKMAAAGQLKDPAPERSRAGKVISKRKAGKHLLLDTCEAFFAW